MNSPNVSKMRVNYRESWGHLSRNILGAFGNFWSLLETWCWPCPLWAGAKRAPWKLELGVSPCGLGLGLLLWAGAGCASRANGCVDYPSWL